MKPFLVCVLALLSPFAAAATDDAGVTPTMADTARQLMQSARADNKAYDIVSSLTTEVGPRLAGTKAEARARTWAVQKLKDMGFANVRVERFEVPLWLRGAEEASIVSPFPQALTVTALGGSASTGVAGVQGEVVAFASLAQLEAAEPGSLQGKIVFVDEVMARSRDGSGYVLAVGKRRKTAFVAQSAGALAALIRSVGTSSDRFAHTGQMRTIDYNNTEAGVPTAALTAPDADQLRRALGYGQPVVVKLVLTTEVLPPAPSGNVIAEIVGREAPEEIVLVGAHLDSWDLGTGAVDDGAGVAIVVAAAHAVMENLPQPPRRTVRVVLFGSEEVGTVGAKAYVERRSSAELGNHIIATESDFGTGNIWQFDTFVGTDKLSAVAFIKAALADLEIAPGSNTAYGGPDIMALRAAGVPVVTLKQDGTDYFDLHHTANDTLDKITPDALDQNVAAYAGFIYLAAESGINFR